MNDAEYRRLVDRVVAVASADDRIQAALIYGSHANGSVDEFSDLDVGLITTDDGFDAVTAGRDELARGLGEPLFVEDFGDPGEVFVLLADGSTVAAVVDLYREIASALAARHDIVYPEELDRLLTGRLRRDKERAAGD